MINKVYMVEAFYEDKEGSSWLQTCNIMIYNILITTIYTTGPELPGLLGGVWLPKAPLFIKNVLYSALVAQ